MSDIDYKRVVDRSVQQALENFGFAKSTPETTEMLDESYVATIKPYKQVTEFVSEKTKETHVELYKGYVDTLNQVSGKLDAVDMDSANSSHSDVRSLKLDEAKNLNAVWLHELFFANCFDPNSEVYMDSEAFMRLQRDFGTFDTWQKDFIACARSCGNGWAVCGYNMFLKRYVNTVIVDNDTSVMVGLYPIIVLDVHEHAYFRDYLNDKSAFITAMLRELNWVCIEERVNKSQKIAEALK